MMQSAHLHRQVGGLTTLCLLASAVLALLSTPAVAQSGSASLVISQIQASAFPLVRCYVSVTDENGESVTGLTRENFTVVEDEQVVSSFRFGSTLGGGEQIAIVIALDRSGSMKGRPLATAKTAAKDFVRRLSDRDRVAVVAFASAVEVKCLFSTDRNIVARKLDRIRPGGETAFLDALHTGVRLLERQNANRKAVVVLTDGKDTASTQSAPSCLAAARNAGVPIYCIGLGRSANKGRLRGIAAKTGGYCFFTESPEALQELYRKIARQLQNQYVIAYESPGEAASGTWHTTSVGVNFGGVDSEESKQYVVTGIMTSAPRVWHMILLIAIALIVAIDAALLIFYIRRTRQSP